MDAITTLIALLVSFFGSFGLLALAAGRWGVDSRPTIGDTRAR